jgi:hypothetical protein
VQTFTFSKAEPDEIQRNDGHQSQPKQN